MLLMFVCGTLAKLGGGPISEGVFIGSFLSMSSTAVVLKCLQDRNWMQLLHGQVILYLEAHSTDPLTYASPPRKLAGFRRRFHQKSRTPNISPSPPCTGGSSGTLVQHSPTTALSFTARALSPRCLSRAAGGVFWWFSTAGDHRHAHPAGLHRGAAVRAAAGAGWRGLLGPQPRPHARGRLRHPARAHVRLNPY
jgi:hypothetical protein